MLSPPLSKGPLVVRWQDGENENNAILLKDSKDNSHALGGDRIPVLSCPVLSCPVLSCPILSYPILSCPSTENCAVLPASDSKNSLNANRRACPEISHQLDSRGFLLALCFSWHQLRHQTGMKCARGNWIFKMIHIINKILLQSEMFKLSEGAADVDLLTSEKLAQLWYPFHISKRQ